MARQQVIQGGTQSVDIGERGERWSSCQQFRGDVAGRARHGEIGVLYREGVQAMSKSIKKRSLSAESITFSGLTSRNVMGGGSAKKPGLQNRRETPTVKGNEIVLTHRRRSLSCRYKYRSPSRLRQVPVWPRWNTRCRT